MGPTKGPVPPADESRRREEKMAVFPGNMAGLGKYCMGGYGPFGIYMGMPKWESQDWTGMGPFTSKWVGQGGPMCRRTTRSGSD